MKRTSNPLILMFTNLQLLYVAVGFLLRIVLLFILPEGASMNVVEIVRALAVGVLNDLCMGTLLCAPMLLVYIGLNEWKYTKLAGTAILVLLLALFCYVAFTHSIFHQYGGVVPRIAIALVGYKLLSFSLRFFLPSIRLWWRKVSLYLLWGVLAYLMIGNAASEVFFWQEFGVRYNFIAVDYLVYTNEVVGNIMESYAIVPFLLLLTGILTAIFIWFITRHRTIRWQNPVNFRQWLTHTAVFVALSIVSLFFLSKLSPRLEGNNLAANQVQQNGAYDFVQAFRSNKLDYDQFYAMIPEEECRQRYNRLCGMNDRIVTDTISATWKEYVANIPRQDVNVVLITVESLSASFMQHYGNTQNITPTLDALYEKSIVFDSLYAVGNRTVRGLEALSLCIPPSAGESIVKRQDNNMGSRSLGYLLHEIGYETQFIYGGDSYFDNMGDYFGSNSYTVIDRKQMDDNEVTFSNIWGVCDEDTYRHALRVFDENQKPFFAQIMTVSNHRPYTYPDGKITFEGNSKSRPAAVKYTDFAIGQFLHDAESHPWFNNTIFIIIADHCASSAGKTSIPVDKYHIPCIIYAPKMISPCRVTKTCSQIDIIPTLLAMLHTSQPTQFAGRNIFADDYTPRAFMATYQDLGFLQDDVLTVLSPKQQVKQFRVETTADGTHTETLMQTLDTTLVKNAQSYYQYVNLYIKSM